MEKVHIITLFFISFLFIGFLPGISYSADTSRQFPDVVYIFSGLFSKLAESPAVTANALTANAKPSLSSTHIPASPKSTDTFTIMAYANDPEGALSTIWIYVDSVLKKTCIVSGPSAFCSYDSRYAVGNHSYFARASDTYGNINTVPKTVFAVSPSEVTVPSVYVSGAPSNSNWIGPTRATVVCTDTGSGCNALSYRIRVSASKPVNCLAESDQSVIYNAGNQSASVYLLMKVQWFNKATGQWLDESIIYQNYGPINIAPKSSILLDQYFNGKWNTGNATHGLGTYRVWVAARDVSGKTLKNPDGSDVIATYTFTISLTKSANKAPAYPYSSPLLVTSRLWVCGMAKDYDLNTGYSTPVEFKVDSKKPSLTVSQFPQYPTSRNNITITATASDAEGGLSSIVIYIDNLLKKTCLVSGPSASCIYSAPLALGNHTYYASARDIFGNINTSLKSTVRVSPSEFVPPVVSITPVPSSWTGSLRAYVACTDTGSRCNNATYRMKTFTTNPIRCPTNQTYTLLSPTLITSYAWVCGMAKDYDLNTGYSTPVEYKVDKIKPVIKTAYSPLNPTSTSNVTITASATDMEGGLSYIYIYTDNLLRKSCAASGPSASCSYTARFAAGNHTYYASAKDVFGNIGISAKSSFTVR